MTRDDIIRIAREAGWTGIYSEWSSPTERTSIEVPVTMEQIERFAALVAAAEREECAKVCYDKAWEFKDQAMAASTKGKGQRLNDAAIAWYDAYEAIRARGSE